MHLKKMNKKGFTLVELLAVIAILAILVVILVPNFVDMFKESKSSVFITEVQTMMKQAQQQWMLDGGGNREFKSNATAAADKLTLDNKSDDLLYYLKMDVNGLFTQVMVCNIDNCLNESGSSVKMANLSDPTVNGNADYTTCKNAVRTKLGLASE